MGSGMVSLLVALIGAIVALVGGYLAGSRQSRLEYKKWLRAREDDLAKEARLAVAEFTRKLATAIHSIVWLAWKARFRSAEITQQDISRYDEEMHNLIPEIVGTLAVISALNKELYERMNELAVELYKLDGQMALTTPALLDSSKPQTDIEAIYNKAYEFNRELTQKVTEVFVEIYQPKSS